MWSFHPTMPSHLFRISRQDEYEYTRKISCPRSNSAADINECFTIYIMFKRPLSPLSSLATADVKGSMEGVLVERFLGRVSDRAKPCLNKAIDYTLLVWLLLLQFMRCHPISITDVVSFGDIQEATQDIVSAKFNFTDIGARSIYQCDYDTNESLLFSSDESTNRLVMAIIAIGFSYGILISVAVWIHSSRHSNNVRVHPLTAELYSFTDRILVIDSALEIPISFYWAPMMTILLWALFAFAFLGVYALTVVFNERVVDDTNAMEMFSSSACLVLLALFKLTGEISQYWVLFKASTREDAMEKFELLQEKKEKSKMTDLFFLKKSDTEMS